MKLTMWVIKCEDDSKAYDIRRPTKKAAIEEWKCLVGQGRQYGSTVIRYTLEYANGFELLDTTAAEGGWEMLVTDRRSYPIRSNG